MDVSPQKHEAETLPSLSGDELEKAQMQCVLWADHQEWDRVKGYAEEHGPEVLLGVDNYTRNDERCHESVLIAASLYKNVEMVKLVLDAGFDYKMAMHLSALESMTNHGANTTILRMLLEHGLDPNVDSQLEGFADRPQCTLLMEVARNGCHIDHAMTLLDHGANVNKVGVDPNGRVGGALACSAGLSVRPDL